MSFPANVSDLVVIPRWVDQIQLLFKNFSDGFCKRTMRNDAIRTKRITCAGLPWRFIMPNSTAEHLDTTTKCT